MIRVLAGLAAWLGGTALAVSLAWLGAGLVVHSTTATPSLPPLATAPSEGSSALAPAPPAPSSPPPAPRRPRPAPSPSRTASPSSSPAGTVRSYMLGGGQVTLNLTATAASLVTAVPKSGWAVQTWSGPQWLRVDFSSGSRVSSLIASWNGTAPSVTITN